MFGEIGVNLLRFKNITHKFQEDINNSSYDILEKIILIRNLFMVNK